MKNNVFSDSLIKLLNLTAVEQAVLSSIRYKDLNVSEIAKISSIPRTTLYTAIDSLIHRNMISSRKEGKSTVLSPISPNMLAERLQSELAEMLESGIFTLHAKNHKREDRAPNSMTYIYGKEAMLDVWQQMARSSKSRFQMIQPTKSLETVLRKYDQTTFIPINNAIKKNKVIMETIMNENSFPTYMDFYKGRKEIQRQILKSFIGRAADTTMVRNNFLQNNADLILNSRSAFLMNWESEVGIKIENRDIVDLLHELFRLAKGYGQKVDLNEYLKKWA